MIKHAYFSCLPNTQREGAGRKQWTLDFINCENGFSLRFFSAMTLSKRPKMFSSFNSTELSFSSFLFVQCFKHALIAHQRGNQPGLLAMDGVQALHTRYYTWSHDPRADIHISICIPGKSSLFVTMNLAGAQLLLCCLNPRPSRGCSPVCRGVACIEEDGRRVFCVDECDPRGCINAFRASLVRGLHCSILLLHTTITTVR